jgi:hypothetical protein
VTLSASSQDTITVEYATQDGTAKAGVDYTAETDTVTFAPGQTTATINVPVTQETLAQHNETFSVVLSNPVDTSGATLPLSRLGRAPRQSILCSPRVMILSTSMT